tara:strand:- start:568 stop:1830 length:1263 start_codon:yes stop_codon:yes gene_type:complete
MSINYTTGNSDESTIDIFYKRYMYQFKIVESAAQHRNVVNFQAEKYLYGRVDHTYVPMVLSIPASNYKYFTNSIDGGASAFGAPAFVVDAFNDLSLQFQKSLLVKKIRSGDSYLSDLKIYKAYENPKLLYGDYLDSFTGTVNGALVKNNLKFKDFNEFMPHFMHAIEAITKVSGPFTYPAFVKNKLCPISTTGLAIEIADLSCANDEDKVRKFINSKNWDFYLNACESYGFLVDMKAPWRLIADIGSPVMLEYAAKYSYNSTNVLIYSAYRYAHSEYYYGGFKRALLTSYNDLKPHSYMEVKQCERSGVKSVNIIKPKEYTIEDFNSLYGETYFLKLYLQIRLLEERPKLTDIEKNRLIDDTLDLHKVLSTKKALLAFERVIGKTYNYSGSLTTLEKGAKLRAEEEFQKEELRGAVSTYR